MNLIRYDAACRAIQAAATVDEAKDIKDQATALAAYARQRSNHELEIQAAEIRARARRRIGEISGALDASKGGANPAATLPMGGKSKSEVLKTAGISTSEADRCEDIASIPEEEVEAFFAECREKGKPVSSDELLRKVQRKHKRKVHYENVKKQSWPQGKYRVIYADPPWQYGDTREGLTTLTGAKDHYETMGLAEICALPVHGIATDPSVLFLWVTAPLLEECFEVVRAWGFAYKQGIVWDKVGQNFGNYFSSRWELLLICTRGSCLPDVHTQIDNVVCIEKSAVHSQKPERFREIIDELYPHGPRIELFARQRHEGWDVWGNEVEGIQPHDTWDAGVCST